MFGESPQRQKGFYHFSTIWDCGERNLESNMQYRVTSYRRCLEPFFLSYFQKVSALENLSRDCTEIAPNAKTPQIWRCLQKVSDHQSRKTTSIKDPGHHLGKTSLPTVIVVIYATFFCSKRFISKALWLLSFFFHNHVTVVVICSFRCGHPTQLEAVSVHWSVGPWIRVEKWKKQVF